MRTVLFLKSNPIDTADLRLENEEKSIYEVWEESELEKAFNVIARPAVTRDELTSHLHKHKPAILHISGHGDVDRDIFLEDIEGYKEEIPLDKFLKLLENFEIECLFLNTCHSLKDLVTLNSKISFVIGMKEEVINADAILFSTEFYKSLFNGRDFNDSFSIALDALGLGDRGAENIPILISKIEPVEQDVTVAPAHVELPNEHEIEKAKEINRNEVKRWGIIIGLVLVVYLSFIFIGDVVRKLEKPHEFVLSLLPLCTIIYPVNRIILKKKVVEILELFQLKILRYKNAFKNIPKEIKEKLNKEFEELAMK